MFVAGSGDGWSDLARKQFGDPSGPSADYIDPAYNATNGTDSNSSMLSNSSISNDNAVAEPTPGAFFFFILYTLIVGILMLNVVVAVLLDEFRSASHTSQHFVEVTHHARSDASAMENLAIASAHPEDNTRWP